MLDIHPIGGPLGAKVHGLDLRKPLEDSTIGRLKDVFYETGRPSDPPESTHDFAKNPGKLDEVSKPDLSVFVEIEPAVIPAIVLAGPEALGKYHKILKIHLPAPAEIRPRNGIGGNLYRDLAPHNEG